MDKQHGNSVSSYVSPLEKYTKYLCYVFGDDPDIIRIITSFSSSHHLAMNTRAYDSPLFVETGGLFGFNKRTFRMDTPLERSIFEVLQRMQKLDFYQPVIEQLRGHMANVSYVISTLEKVSSLNVSPLQINKLFVDLFTDFDKLFKQFFYYYFMNLDEQTVRSWFNLARNAFDSYEIEVLSLCKNIRESLADCCANRSNNSSSPHISGAGFCCNVGHTLSTRSNDNDGGVAKRGRNDETDQAFKHQRFD